MSTEDNDQLLRLFELDKSICGQTTDIVDILFTKTRISRLQPNSSKNVKIAGSIPEGCTVARLFQEDALFDDKGGINREIELDLEWIIFEVSRCTCNLTGFLLKTSLYVL